MTDCYTNTGRTTQLVDWVFSRIAGDPEAILKGIGSALPTQGEPTRAELGETQLPPTIRGPADVQAAYDWLRREKRRLEGYTQSQLALLQSEHQALVKQNYANESAIIGRSQELSRQQELLAEQSQELQRQDLQLSQHEQELAAQREQWQKAQEELAANQERHARMCLEAEAQVAVLESLKLETAALTQSREAARADLEALALAITEQRVAWEKDQAQLESRLQAADQAEAAVRRREREVDELETLFLEEMEKRELQLAEERREWEADNASRD